jgi:hypothetical protein
MNWIAPFFFIPFYCLVQSLHTIAGGVERGCLMMKRIYVGLFAGLALQTTHPVHWVVTVWHPGMYSRQCSHTKSFSRWVSTKTSRHSMPLLEVINMVPYERLQGYIRGIDLRSAVQNNIAFKLYFGYSCYCAAVASVSRQCYLSFKTPISVELQSAWHPLDCTISIRQLLNK